MNKTTASKRTCSRRGCGNPVNKPTGKYCSKNCCTIDPERHERLRVQARRNGRRNIIPLVRQLKLEIPAGISSHPEAELELIAVGREDVPRGMSRL